MNVVDSSAWMAWFADSGNARHFADAILDTKHLLIPTITLIEVFKSMARQQDRSSALKATSRMKQGRVIELDSSLALRAAACGLQLGLPLADSIIYATAQRHDAVLWTQDADFEGLAGVQFFPAD